MSPTTTTFKATIAGYNRKYNKEYVMSPQSASDENGEFKIWS